MTIRTLLTTGLLLPTLALVACDSGDGNDDAPDAGRFEADVTGNRTASLEGVARFEVATEDGETLTAVGLVDRDDPQDVIAVVLDSAPRTGSFSVATEEAGAILVLGEGEEGDLYTTTGGTVTITRAADDRLEGRFDVEAVNLTDETDVVSIEGTFAADEGDVAQPARVPFPGR